MLDLLPGAYNNGHDENDSDIDEIDLVLSNVNVLS